MSARTPVDQGGIIGRARGVVGRGKGWVEAIAYAAVGAIAAAGGGGGGGDDA